MKRCVLDGGDAAAAYRRLAAAFEFPPHFGANPDALWDALGDYAGEPVTVVWRAPPHPAGEMAAIRVVLEQAAAAGMLTLDPG
jgi:RNAse (barnase) inhibitor barstar